VITQTANVFETEGLFKTVSWQAWIDELRVTHHEFSIQCWSLKSFAIWIIRALKRLDPLCNSCWTYRKRIGWCSQVLRESWQFALRGSSDTSTQQSIFDKPTEKRSRMPCWRQLVW
jgi:hypothetical protein